MQPKLGQRFAGREAEIGNDKVTFDWRGILCPGRRDSREAQDSLRVFAVICRQFRNVCAGSSRNNRIDGSTLVNTVGSKK